MSTLKISKHSDVPAALDLVKEEVDKEAQRIYTAGGEALKAGHVRPAKEAIAYAEKLSDFVRRIQKLGEAWSALEKKIDAAAPEVKEIVRLPKSRTNHRTGYSRNVTTIAPGTNFEVIFPDGAVISAKEARLVMARSIEKLGPQAVASLGVMIGGEPLVARTRSAFKKYPGEVVEIKDGWLVKTHSGTKAKIGYVSKIAKALKVNVKIRSAAAARSSSR